MYGKADLHFKDGTRIKKEESGAYLGSTISETVDRNLELNARLGTAIATHHALDKTSSQRLFL